MILPAGSKSVDATRSTSLCASRSAFCGDGDVTTIAGLAGNQAGDDGTGSNARFFFPQGVFCDGLGNLYVADSANHKIRKIVLSTNEVTTVVGKAGEPGAVNGSGGPSGMARFDYPVALWSDGTASRPA